MRRFLSTLGLFALVVWLFSIHWTKGVAALVIIALVAARYWFYPLCNACGSAGCTHWQDEIMGRLPPGSTGQIVVGKKNPFGYRPGVYGSPARTRFQLWRESRGQRNALG